MDHQILARTPINEKKRICLLVDFSVLIDIRVQRKESEILCKIMELAKELKIKQKTWNMKPTEIPPEIDSLGMVPNVFGKETGGT